MIKGQYDHADRGGQEERYSVEQQRGHDLLYGHDFEEPIDHFGRVLGVPRRCFDARESHGQILGVPSEDPSLN